MLSDELRHRLLSARGIGPKTIGEVEIEIDAAFQRGVAEGRRLESEQPNLATARQAIRDYGTPPPGEGRHPLQGHRDSMG